MKDKFLNRLADIIARYPVHIVALAILLTVISIFYTAKNIYLDADQDHLVSEKLDYHKRYLDYIKNFGDQEYIYVAVETNGNSNDAENFVLSFVDKIKNIQGIKKIIYQINNPALEKSFLLFLSQNELSNLKDLIGGKGASLREAISRGNAEGLFRMIAGQLVDPKAEDEEKLMPLFSFFQQAVDNLDKTLQGGKPSFDLAKLFFGSSSYNEKGFLASNNGKFMFVLIMPEKNFQTLEVIKKPLANIREALNETKKEFPNISAGITGRPVLAFDEMTTTNNDMNKATTLAIIAIAVIFMLALRSITSPLFAVISLLMGISFTYAFSTLVFGSLNLLTVIFAIILVGSAIEYGIHIVTRTRQERAKGKIATEAVKDAMMAVGAPNITSALTTSAAFTALLFTDFTAIAQLGFISAVGIIMCLLTSLTVLPAMLIIRERYRKNVLKVRAPIKLSFLLKIYKHWKYISVAALILFIITLFLSKNMQFNHNLLSLQANGLESVQYEMKLVNETDESSWFAVGFAKSIDESERLANNFIKLSSVKKVEDISTALPSHQDEKIKLINTQLAPVVKNIELLKTTPSDPIKLKQIIQGIRLLLEGLAEEAFTAGRGDATEEIENLTLSLKKVEDNLSEANADKLHEWETTLFSKLMEGVDLLKSSLNPPKILFNDLPEILKTKFVGKNGLYAVYVYPKEDIWDPTKLDEFVTNIRTVDPIITGTPIEVFESSKLLENTFKNSAIIASFIIFAIASIYFISPYLGAFAITPLVFGIGWLLGIMMLSNLHFNLANFFAIPIILGVGIDSAIHIITRIRDEKNLVSVTESTGTGVFLTVMTNIVGFGMLIIAHHNGIKSLGQIMAIGALMCFIASIIVLPPIVHKFIEKRYEQNK